ncbi:MAG: COX15/CtaA family protein [Labilithrix sp.]|nr:COX15/CtaA family protein [Labilithrix sp.]MCW5810527.1 COX15/CtaA family protein [Labilithrix sp.]
MAAAAAADLSLKEKKVARLGWAVLAWNVAVVLWGAFVRASGSGAGCGRHWPLCNGEVVPRAESTATLIEAAHRVTSGLALVAVVALLVVAMRNLPKGHRARRGAGFATFFVFGEAAIGAALVLFELVAHDASMKRGLSMTLHLCNTFLLLGALALTAWWAQTGQGAVVEGRAKVPFALRSVVVLALGGVLLLGASGAVAALGDTLFPAASLREGIAQDLSPLSHVFLKLRMLHPIIALGTGILTLGAAGVVRALSTSERAWKLSRGVTVLFVTQFACGILNLTLLAPIGMQLVHLLLADATWIMLVLMGWEALRGAATPAPALAPVAEGAGSTPDVAAV